MKNTAAMMHGGTIAFSMLGLSMLCLTGTNARPVHPRHPARANIPGGANQVQGLRGKVGDLLFDGHWRFQVLSVQTRHAYALTVPASEQDFGQYNSVADFDDETHTFTAKNGFTFVVVKCHVKNGQPHAENLDGYSNDPKTAVTDSLENSYPPFAYDMVTSGAWITKGLLPGSGEDLTVLFAIPQNVMPQALVFTLKNYSDPDGRNVRVALGETAHKPTRQGDR